MLNKKLINENICSKKYLNRFILDQRNPEGGTIAPIATLNPPLPRCLIFKVLYNSSPLHFFSFFHDYTSSGNNGWNDITGPNGQTIDTLLHLNLVHHLEVLLCTIEVKEIKYEKQFQKANGRGYLPSTSVHVVPNTPKQHCMHVFLKGKK